MSVAVAAEKGRVSALDSVRAVAILTVIATHSLSATVAVTQSYAIPAPIFRFFDYGQFGVQVFFALSGWLIFSLYYGQEKRISASHYWSRRIARIWPLWVVFVLLYFLIYQIDTSGLPTWVAIVLAILFLGWTVGTLAQVPTGGLTIQQEMGHYLVFWLLRKRTINTFIASVIVGYTSFYVATWLMNVSQETSPLDQVLNAWLRLGLYNSWPFFVLGGLSYLGYSALRRGSQGNRSSILSPTGATLLIIALALSAVSVYAQETPGYFVLGYVVLAALLGLGLNRIPLLNRVSWSIGRYSYFMYFFHFLVLRQLEGSLLDSGLISPNESIPQNVALLIVIFVATTAISWAVAWVSWRVFESPIMRAARKRYP